MTPATPLIARTPVLDIAYESVNDSAAEAVILLHGFPYDVRAFDAVVPALAARGLRVVVPYLRGFGATAFRSRETPRSGQQAALGRDLIDLMDALKIENAVVGGYDWGGRAACIAAAIFPERVIGLVSVDGYNIQNLASAGEPDPPAWESTYWYQYYFQTERGRRGLELNRDELCELLWRSWSPTWTDAAAAFQHSSASLHNPDFVDVVIHSYRHRMGAAPGDPRYQGIEDLLAASPKIAVPTIVLECTADGIGGPSASEDAPMFVGPFQHRLIEGVGHNVPQEAPEAFSRAILDVRALRG
ncbi:pimeloyl-ACP methyl ester carboxylesterase [Glaciihabitans tibetensis]|uniref:Pimeloyl-ACP methyl ester carboxylesterase n=1 Tax=Glaciihabitans tibetensis TaxID=1266600 RepID=A0A2T0V7A6_9MICO|nr:alpha/beta hydrolase [Glaciihabitans tibetensis]PRY65938.1 pimeloyl-ACP methyl ester carboxylesterase [Glaciihabitans tibetensis]